jgi:hypothetical protein
MSSLEKFCLSFLATAWFLCGDVQAQAQAGASDALRSSFEAAREHTRRISLDRPVYLESTETPDRLRGDVYTLVDHPFADVRVALTRAERWCDILILHVNVQYCRATGAPGHELLNAGIGRKIDQPLADVYWLDLVYEVPHGGDDYLNIELKASNGPLGTKDYLIVVEVAAYGAAQSVMHFTYAYSYGFMARLAMQAYLMTGGSKKVGFSVIGANAEGLPTYIGGVRGVLERNTMRYYLAIESYLGAQGGAAGTQLAKRLDDWYSATERYPIQLHEIERDAYLEMKHRQVTRQESGPLVAHTP